MSCQTNCIRLGLAFLAIAGSAQASTATTRYLNSGQLRTQLNQIAASHPDNVKVLDIGQSLDNNHLYVLRIGTGGATTPAMLALFGQHADEHETTNLAIGMARTLLEKAAADEQFANELDKVTVYIAPMANPDGMDYDLRDPDEQAGWRKNRSPQASYQFGVDLNRNWGSFWDAPTDASAVPKHVKDSADPDFRGPAPFSEKETQAFRDFILAHDDIQMLVDYHTGSASFMQGAVLLPYSYSGKAVPSAASLCAEQLPEKFAAAISTRKDSRKPFHAIQSGQMKDLVIEDSPFLLKPLLWAAVPGSTGATGTAIDWTASNGTCSMGVEIALRHALPRREEEAALIENQSRGILLLLDSLRPAPQEHDEN